MRDGRGDATAHLPLAPAIAERFASLRRLIGGTPLIEVRCRYQGRRVSVYAMHEIINFTGSIKDRMALHILQEAYRRGDLRPGWIIAEATSGNTGIAFAAIGRALGHPVQIYMPDWMSQERVLLLRAWARASRPSPMTRAAFSAASARPTTSRSGSRTSSCRISSRTATTSRRTTERPAPRSWISCSNWASSPRISSPVWGPGAPWRALGGSFASGSRASGSIPSSLPTRRRCAPGSAAASTASRGSATSSFPPILDLRELDEIVDVWDGDASLMAQKLASKLGLGVGVSSGANLLGVICLAAEHGPAAVVATIFPDSNKKYLSTDLCKDEPVRDDYLSPQVELEDLRVVSARV